MEGKLVDRKAVVNFRSFDVFVKYQFNIYQVIYLYTGCNGIAGVSTICFNIG